MPTRSAVHGPVSLATSPAALPAEVREDRHSQMPHADDRLGSLPPGVKRRGNTVAPPPGAGPRKVLTPEERRRIVEEHGGRIDLFSEPGKGSYFVVRLPPRRPADLSRAVAEQGAAGGRVRVRALGRRDLCKLV